MRIAVVEPYLAGSHRAWAEGYAEHSGHDVEVFGLPGQHWKWRMQGAHVTLAPLIADAARARGAFDVLFVSDMASVAGLRGLLGGDLGSRRVVLYMHENQLTFPMSPHEAEDLTYAMINWTSMVAADAVIFNSEFHRRDFFEALPGFLRRFPDHRHTALIDEVAAKTSVLPVGVELAELDHIERVRHRRPLVLWNQRWEHDKGPTAFVDAVGALVADGLDFDVAVAGDRPHEVPGDLARLRRVLGARLVFDAYASSDEYRRLLRRADVVVSTALHEFFGIAVTEAVYAGAFPVFPNRLVYPERLPADYHDRCLYDSADDLIAKLAWAIEHRDQAAEMAAVLKPAMAENAWSRIAARYDDTLERPTGARVDSA